VSGFPVRVPQELDVPSWHLLPPVAPPARVLYLGTGGGDVAARLALSFGVLLVVEPTLDQARATRARSDALGCGQVLTVCGDVRRLPLRPGSLDLAVLDVPLSATDGADRRPAAVLGLLRPGGFLCLRLHAGSGSADAPMAARGPDRLALLLSLNRLRRLLRDSSYDDIRVWSAYPDCADPKFIVECKQPVFDYFVRHFGKNPKTRLRATAQRLFNAARLLRYAAPGYLLLARRSTADPA
jgi:hypothetical protein